MTPSITNLTPDERKEELRLLNNLHSAFNELHAAVDAMGDADMTNIPSNDPRWAALNERHSQALRRQFAATMEFAEFWKRYGAEPFNPSTL